MSDKATKTVGCEHCPVMEQKYSDNPRSFWMRLWKWHSGWCPKHKEYHQAEQAKLSEHGHS